MVCAGHSKYKLLSQLPALPISLALPFCAMITASLPTGAAETAWGSAKMSSAACAAMGMSASMGRLGVAACSASAVVG